MANDSEIIKKLCLSFNTHFLSSRNPITSLVDTIDKSSTLAPGLRTVSGKAVLMKFKPQLDIRQPAQFRQLTIDVLTYVMTEYAGSSASGSILAGQISTALVPLKHFESQSK